jgi:DNA-binding MarR family transcriptional regulator
MGGDEDERSRLVALLIELGERDSTETALFHQAAAARYGVGISEMKALGVLLREGPMSAGALASALNVTSGAVTGVVDRLIKQRMAMRSEDPVDRRRVVIEADVASLSAGENVYMPMGEAFAELYSEYTTEQLRFLARHLERSVAITRGQIDRLEG